MSGKATSARTTAHVLSERTLSTSLLRPQQTAGWWPSGYAEEDGGFAISNKNSMAVTTLRLEPAWVDFGLSDGNTARAIKDRATFSKILCVSAAAELSHIPTVRAGDLVAGVPGHSKSLPGTRIVIKGASSFPTQRRRRPRRWRPRHSSPVRMWETYWRATRSCAQSSARSLQPPQAHDTDQVPCTCRHYTMTSQGWSWTFSLDRAARPTRVAKLNEADGGNRRRISVNIPEPVPAGSTADEMGLKFVSDIAVTRLEESNGGGCTARWSGTRGLLTQLQQLSG